MENIRNLNILPLIPLGIGVVGGIFLTTKVLERLMERHPQPTYLIILGFMFGSLPELFPGFPRAGRWYLARSPRLPGSRRCTPCRGGRRLLRKMAAALRDSRYLPHTVRGSPQ